MRGRSGARFSRLSPHPALRATHSRGERVGFRLVKAALRPRIGRAKMASLLVLVLGASCAHVEPPPGGPEDRTPPTVASTTPESEAVVESYDGPVVFRFNERISETGVQDAVSVSPRTSPVEVSHGRSEIRVSLRNGWVPNAIYHIRIGTEVRDLFNNRLTDPLQLVFSTGPEIPDTRVTGTVVDRITGRPAADHRVEAIRMADSLVYATQSGTSGGFEFTRIPEGEYHFRAFEDINRSRSLEAYEPRDSVAGVMAVAAGEPVELAFSVLTPDSTGAVIESIVARDGVVEIEFDDYLDPTQELAVEQVQVAHPTDGPVALARIAIGELTPADTATAADGADDAARLPSQTLAVELAEGAALQPGTDYSVRVTRVRNVNGIVADSEGTLQVADPDAGR